MKKLMQFIRDEEGVTAVEYGLVAGLISILIIVAAGASGDALQDIFEAIQTALEGATPL